MSKQPKLLTMLAAGCAACLVAGHTLGPARAVGALDGQDFAKIERGRYLTVLADCAACHTATGDKPFAGGRAIETPFGKILAPNITPDLETGIGAWTDVEFSSALKRGTGRNGQRLYPAMPFVYMTKMRDEDVSDIRAYLNTLKPIHNPVQANQLPFPFNIRLGMALWDALYFREGDFLPTPGKSEEWNRGAYLVEALAHCGACHTPKSLLGGDKAGQDYQGYSIQGWFAPDITNDGYRGLGGWTIADVVTYLKTGHNRYAAASGPMAEEVSQSSSHVRDSDLQAIAVYLKDQASSEDGKPSPVDAKTPEMTAGSAIYRDVCSACHAPDGSGVPELIPTLKGSASAQSREPTSLVRVVLQGVRSVATQVAPTGPAMPAYDWQLNDEQVAAVTTYVRNAWGNAAPAVSPEEVGKARAKLASRSE